MTGRSAEKSDTKVTVVTKGGGKEVAGLHRTRLSAVAEAEAPMAATRWKEFARARPVSATDPSERLRARGRVPPGGASPESDTLDWSVSEDQRGWIGNGLGMEAPE